MKEIKIICEICRKENQYTIYFNCVEPKEYKIFGHDVCVDCEHNAFYALQNLMNKKKKSLNKSL
jgi:hypothetical protein